ncbi:MAG: ribosome maturation factor RimM [Alphaproteobacteria bacterium]|nr:ribosome maturation factor RimM [Alphaproteobacteria bacterium]
MNKTERICVGKFSAAHGIGGCVRLKSYTEKPENIFKYPLTDKEGKAVFEIVKKHKSKDCFVVAIKGIEDRNAAEALKGVLLYTEREELPKGQYYEADIIGMTVRGNGKEYGNVMNMYDYGAGVFAEIGTNKKDSFMFPFKEPFVTEVDVESGILTIDVPEDYLEQ